MGSSRTPPEAIVDWLERFHIWIQRRVAQIRALFLAQMNSKRADNAGAIRSTNMSDTAEVHSVLASINAAWREGDPSAMREYLHPEIAMIPPDFSQSLRGRDLLVAGFEEFCANAKVLEYEEMDKHIDVVGDCAAATFRFRMLYERATYREDCSGRDLWLFARQNGRWIAVWRAMLELKAERFVSDAART